MRMTKPICAAMALLLILLSFAACGKTDTEPTDPTPTEPADIYDFESYENDEVLDIERVELSDEFEQFCRTYKFYYLSDGYKVEAYLTVPLSDIKSQKPAKCVVYNHGGNNDLGALDDSTTASVCSALGRIVIASQYRGCGNSQGKDDFGGENLNDVIKLIDLCENRFRFIDMDDLCAVGVSRGGVMTYPAARKDSRIKKIIALSALTDLIEAYESREDLMKLTLIECIGCSPDENPEEYKKRSAIYWADEIKIPVLIIHSKGDQQVSFSQAEAMYEKLKDVEGCKLISHDDDVHGTPHKEDIPAIREWLNDQ